MSYPEAEMAKEKVTFFFHRHRSTGKRPPQGECKAKYDRLSTPIVRTVSKLRQEDPCKFQAILAYNETLSQKPKLTMLVIHQTNQIMSKHMVSVTVKTDSPFYTDKMNRSFDSVSFYAVNHQLFVANVF